MVEILKPIEQSPFDEAAEVIKKGGVYERKFKPPDAADIMSGFVTSIVKKHGATETKVVSMDAGIEKNTGTIISLVKVIRPVGVTIDLNCVLDNGSPCKLELTDLIIGTDAKGVTGFILIVNLKGKPSAPKR